MFVVCGEAHLVERVSIFTTRGHLKGLCKDFLTFAKYCMEKLIISEKSFTVEYRACALACVKAPAYFTKTKTNLP